VVTSKYDVVVTGEVWDDYAANSILSGWVKIPKSEVSKVGLLCRSMKRVHRRSQWHNSDTVRAKSLPFKTSKRDLSQSVIVEALKYAGLALHKDELESMWTKEGTPLLRHRQRSKLALKLAWASISLTKVIVRRNDFWFEIDSNTISFKY
jgi:hypothetical protein